MLEGKEGKRKKEREEVYKKKMEEKEKRRKPSVMHTEQLNEQVHTHI